MSPKKTRESKTDNPMESGDITIEEVSGDGNGHGTVGGKLAMSADVVATLAGMAARDIDGVYALGRSRMIQLGNKNPTRGVEAEVGEREAAVDLEMVIEYGANIHEVASSLRQRIADSVYRTAGRKVKEVNINVIDIHMPTPEAEEPTTTEEPQPRVQ